MHIFFLFILFSILLSRFTLFICGFLFLFVILEWDPRIGDWGKQFPHPFQDINFDFGWIDFEICLRVCFVPFETVRICLHALNYFLLESTFYCGLRIDWNYWCALRISLNGNMWLFKMIVESVSPNFKLKMFLFWFCLFLKTLEKVWVVWFDELCYQIVSWGLYGILL